MRLPQVAMEHQRAWFARLRSTRNNAAVGVGARPQAPGGRAPQFVPGEDAVHREAGVVGDDEVPVESVGAERGHLVDPAQHLGEDLGGALPAHDLVEQLSGPSDPGEFRRGPGAAPGAQPGRTGVVPGQGVLLLAVHERPAVEEGEQELAVGHPGLPSAPALRGNSHQLNASSRLDPPAGPRRRSGPTGCVGVGGRAA